MNIFKPKTKQEKQIQLVLLIIVLAIVVWFLWKKVIQPRVNANKYTPELPGAAASTSSAGSSAPSGAGSSPGLAKIGGSTLLKEGTKAQEVQWLQYYYNTKLAGPKNLIKLQEDGIFGAKTKQVVQTVMNSSTTTWDAFKKKVDLIVSQGTTSGGNNVFDLWPWLLI